jgi:hypothetical protein
VPRICHELRGQAAVCLHTVGVRNAGPHIVVDSYSLTRI